jgi:hypothetical protein
MKNKSGRSKTSTTSKLKADIKELELRRKKTELQREVFLAELIAEGNYTTKGFAYNKMDEEEHEQDMRDSGII